MSEEPKLSVIHGDRQSSLRRAGRRRALTESEQVTCWKCEVTTGIATSRFHKATVAPRRSPDGKIKGGTQFWVCDYCGTTIAPIR